MDVISIADKLQLPDWLGWMFFADPWQQAIFVFAIDAGVLMFCWWVLERVFWRQYFLSNIFGDTIGLPLIALGEIGLLQHLPDHAVNEWYTTWWWYVLAAVVPTLAFAKVTWDEYRSDPKTGVRLTNKAQFLSPSKLYHTVMWPLFAFILVAPAPAALSLIGEDSSDMLRAMGGVVIWGFSLFAIDFNRVVPPLGGIVEFQWNRLLRRKPSSIRVDQWERVYGADWIGWKAPLWFRPRYTPQGIPRRH